VGHGPEVSAPDRDGIYGPEFLRSVSTLGIEDVRASPRSPWQNPYVERLIGSIRRECLDHVVIVNERHLRHVLHEYLSYYSEARTHLGLEKDSPETRAIEPRKPAGSSRFHGSAVCTTATHAARRKEQFPRADDAPPEARETSNRAGGATCRAFTLTRPPFLPGCAGPTRRAVPAVVPRIPPCGPLIRPGSSRFAPG